MVTPSASGGIELARRVDVSERLELRIRHRESRIREELRSSDPPAAAPFGQVTCPTGAFAEQRSNDRCKRDTVDGEQRLPSIADDGDDGVVHVVEEPQQRRTERGSEKWDVHRKHECTVGSGTERVQPGEEPLERSAGGVRVPYHLDSGTQGR